MKTTTTLLLFGLLLIGCKKEEDLPISPQSLKATAKSPNSIDLSWNGIANSEAGYVLERKTNNTPYKEIIRLQKNTFSFLDSGLQFNTTYIYRIYSLNVAGIMSPPSNEAQATTMDAPPLAPGSLTISIESSKALKLNWVDNSINENAFVVQRKKGIESFTNIATLSKNSVSFIDSTVLRDSIYSYRVKAIDQYQMGNYSNEVSGKAEWVITGLNFSLIHQGYALRVVANKDSSVLMVSGNNNVLKSTDNGNTWQATIFPSGIVNDYGAGFTDNGGIGQWIFGTNGGNFVSTTNQGNSFSLYGPAGWGCGSFFIQGLSDGSFIASKTGYLRGIYKSSGTDNSIWSNVYPGVDPRGITVNEMGVYVAVGGNSILKSTNLGNSWSLLAINTVANDLNIIKDTLYWFDERSNLFKAPLNNLTSETNIKNFGEATGAMWPRIINYSPSLLIVTAPTKGFFISKDGGKNWVNYTCPGASYYFTSSIIKNRIFVCTDTGLFVTELK